MSQGNLSDDARTVRRIAFHTLGPGAEAKRRLTQAVKDAWGAVTLAEQTGAPADETAALEAAYQAARRARRDYRPPAG